MKLKTKKSAKVAERYLLIEGASKSTIEKAILDYIGILGWAKASPKFVKDYNGNRAILSVDRKAVNDVRASLELSNKKIKVLRVSGTLKGLRK